MVGKMVVDPLGAVRVALPVLTSVPMAGVIKLVAFLSSVSLMLYGWSWLADWGAVVNWVDNIACHSSLSRSLTWSIRQSNMC